MSGQTIYVTIYDRNGRPFTYNAIAASFRNAVQSAAQWFKDRDGTPIPTRDTVYELSVPGDPRKWRVCGGTVQTVLRPDASSTRSLDQPPKELFRCDC